MAGLEQTKWGELSRVSPHMERFYFSRYSLQVLRIKNLKSAIPNSGKSLMPISLYSIMPCTLRIIMIYLDYQPLGKPILLHRSTKFSTRKADFIAFLFTCRILMYYTGTAVVL